MYPRTAAPRIQKLDHFQVRCRQAVLFVGWLARHPAAVASRRCQRRRALSFRKRARAAAQCAHSVGAD